MLDEGREGRREREKREREKTSFFAVSVAIEEREREREREREVMGMGVVRTRRKVLAGALGCTALGFAALYVHQQHALEKKKKKKNKREDSSSKGSKGKTRSSKSSKKILALLLRGSVPSLAALSALACARTALANRLSTLQGGLFKTAFLRQKVAFARLLGENFVGCLILSYIQSHFSKMIQGLEMEWRSSLTGGLHNKYFGGMNYYKCSHVDKSVANPEQRICEDVPKYCSGMAQCTGEVICSLVDVLFYSQRLSSYTRTHRYTMAMVMYIFGAGTLTKVVSPNFAKMYKKKQSLEGSYRMAQSRLRSNSESVAFYNEGIQVEAKTIEYRLIDMLQHNSKLLFKTWKFSMVQDFVLKYFGATFAVILIIGPFFEGHLRPKDNMVGRAQMLSNMRYHTGVVISLFTALGVLGSMPSKTSKLKAYAQRIGELQDLISSPSSSALKLKGGESKNAQKPFKDYKDALTYDVSEKEEIGTMQKSNSIVFENATVSTPAGHVLIRDLNLVIEEGTNLLVTGPNGAGKSSLFRVLGGLWHLESGHVYKPTRSDSGEKDEGLASDIFYVPQKPYVSVGSLIEQLIYPSTLEKDRQLLDNPTMLTDLLEQVDLLYLLTDFGRYTSNADDDTSVSSKTSSERDVEDPSLKKDTSYFDASTTVVNWSEVLSLGEQQRLGMARLFYHKPRFAILDECTSGVTNDMEERFCEIVERMGCTCITISHRPALVAFHDKVLHLDGEGGWSLRDLEHQKEDSSSSEDEKDEKDEKDEEEDAGVDDGSDYRKMASAEVFEGMIKKKKKPKKPSNSKSHEAEQSTQHLGDLIDEHILKQSSKSSNSLPSVPNMEKLVKSDESGKGSVSATSMLNLVGRLLFAREKGEKRKGKVSKKKTMKRIVTQGSDAVHLSALAACVVLRTAISDRIANLNGQTVYYVINQDRRGFYKLMLTSAFQGLSNAVIASSLKYLTDHLALGWRERLTNHLLEKYFKKDSFYRSVHIQHLRDVDQRITRDVERWCDDLAAVVPCAIKPVLDAAWFSWRCYRLTGVKGISLLYLYMVFGYTTLKAISPDLGMASKIEHDYESAFRQSHIALRERAESVAFFGGGYREKQNIHKRFLSLKKHVMGSLSMRFNHDFYENFLTNQLPHNVTWIISMLFSIQYPIDIGTDVNNQAAMVKEMRYLATVITQTFTSFGDILGLHKRYTELAGGAARIEEVFEQMRESESLVIDFETDKSGTKIKLKHCDVETPSAGLTGSSCLAQDLSITVRKGSSLLISGPNGSGKSSLMRVLARLWPLSGGTLTVPRELFFVTQKPYLTIGSLREQIIYPKSLSDLAHVEGLDEKLYGLLSEVRLTYLLERWGWDNPDIDFANVLSLGEQQRLCMCRGFFHKPTFLVLDECTNAVSVDVEENLYQFAQDLGITMLTITQRSALIEYHKQELKLLDGRGSWQHYNLIEELN